MEIFYVTIKEAPEEPTTEATGLTPTDLAEVPREPMQTAAPDEPIIPEKNQGINIAERAACGKTSCALSLA